MGERPSIAVVGAVGVPARYGGFETLAEQLARHVPPEEATLHLYCQKSAYEDGERAAEFAGHYRHFLPLSANGPQSLIHDMLAIIHATFVLRAESLLILGTSGAWALPITRLLRPSVRVVTNIDGLEWRRDKFGAVQKRVLKILEWVAAKCSHDIIADNAALIPTIKALHGIDPVLIAYGGDHTLVEIVAQPDAPAGHWLAIARIEPENNSEMILEAAVSAGATMVFVGNWNANGYGRDLRARFAEQPGIDLRDPVYDQAELAHLRSGAIGYVHGHSVGGTNPSLVEALFHTDRILAFDCPFNRATLANSGAFFSSSSSLVELLSRKDSGSIGPQCLDMLRASYRWRQIAVTYIATLAPGSG